jgi:starch-binding outer membrane protein, SusD/RagB family
MKKYSLYILSALTIWVLGCKEEFLDRPPLSNLTAGTFFNNDAELANSTTALYNIVWFGANGHAMVALGDVRGGNFFPPYGQPGWQQYGEFAVSNTNGELRDSWASLFNVVGQANVLIQNVNQFSKPAVSETAKRTAIAEARFMRAVAYSYLVQNWGPVPIITDNLKQAADTTLARNTVNSVWEFVIRDMRFAKDNLPVVTVNGRVNKYSAEGMLARFYLTRSGIVPNFDNATFGKHARNQADLDSAKYYANDVIVNGPFKLMENYGDLFLTKNNNNSEQLFGLQWVPLREPWGVGNQFQSQFAVNSTITGGTDGWGGAHGATIDYLEKLDPADSIRRRATFMFPGDHYPELNKKGGGWKQPIPTANDWNNWANFKKYIVGTPDDNEGKGQVQATGNNTYMQRLSDVYLIYAEAALGNSESTTDATALEYFNRVRSRAGLPVLNEITMDAIMYERRFEFALEGDSWYTIARMYYYDPEKALAFINSQKKGIYKLEIKEGTGTPGKKREFLLTERQLFPVNASRATVFLPIPDFELAQAPNLAKPPVEYKFE